MCTPVAPRQGLEVASELEATYLGDRALGMPQSTYLTMVQGSIAELGDLQGTPLPALTKSVQGKRGDTFKKHALLAALKRGVETGALTLDESKRYKLVTAAVQRATGRRPAKTVAAAGRAGKHKAPTRTPTAGASESGEGARQQAAPHKAEGPSSREKRCRARRQLFNKQQPQQAPSPAAVAEGRSCRWVWRKLGQSPGEGPADRDTPIYGEITEAGMLAIYSKWWPATDGA